MEQDPFFVYGPNGRAVAFILDQAAEMNLDQIAATAKASDSTTGYLGRKRSWLHAGRGLLRVAAAHNRTTDLIRAKDHAMDSVIDAVRRIVVSNEKSDARISECWQNYLAPLTDSNPRLRKKAYRKLQGALKEGIGTSARLVPLASGAASTAAQVAVVWDLANEGSGFTPTDRDLLMSPWLTAFSLPPDLAAAS